MNYPSQICPFYHYDDGKIWGVPILLARQCITFYSLEIPCGQSIMKYVRHANIFRCASMRNMEFIFKFHSLFSVVRQLLITSAMLHSVTNLDNIRCISGVAPAGGQGRATAPPSGNASPPVGEKLLIRRGKN